MSTGIKTCLYCDKIFSDSLGLKRHLKRIHNQPITKKLNKCQFYDNCDYTFFTLKEYRVHLNKKHQIACTTEILKFTSKQDFTSWLETTEHSANVQFSIGASEKFKAGKKFYYYCNRSGKHKPTSKGKRQLKTQGSRKTGLRCPSGFTVTMQGELPEYNKFEVVYFPMHLGHDKLLGHTSIPKSVRSEIAIKLIQNVPAQRIVSDIRSTKDERPGRKHVLTLKDVKNIKASLGICNNQKKSFIKNSSPINFKTWVQSQRDLGDESSILFYKPSNEFHCNLQTDDFVLVIMTPLQKRMTTMYEHDQICFDSTQQVNDYDFIITSFMIANDREEGFPAAFCISSKINKDIMSIFINSVKHVVGLLHPTSLLSNDSSVYYDAWHSVMYNKPLLLLSPWHVDQAWKLQLQIIEDIQTRNNIYSLLIKCLYEPNVVNFNIMLSELVEILSHDDDPLVLEFKDYFVKTFCNRVAVWACSYRHVGIETIKDTSFENYSKNLTNIYIQGMKRGRGIDGLIDLLVTYLIDKLPENIVRLQKVKVCLKNTKKVDEMHRLGLKLSPRCSILAPNLWFVPSEDTLGIGYSVQKTPHICQDVECAIKCPDCLSCINQFKCSCHYFTGGSELCAHIHSVNIYNRTTTIPKSALQTVRSGTVCNTTAQKQAHRLSNEIDSSISYNNKRVTNLLNACLGNFNNSRVDIPEQMCVELLGHLDSVNKLINLAKTRSPREDEIVI